jgi:hypothetical protein
VTRLDVYDVLVAGRAVDGRGDPLTGVRVECDRPGTRTRIASGGQFVVAGVAGLVFPHLATAADSVTVRLEAPGRETFELAVPLVAGSVPPVLLGDVAIPGPAVGVAGQVRREDLSQDPIPGALIRFVTDASVPGLFPLALRIGVPGARAATTTVRATTVASAGAPVTCPAGARAGDEVLAATGIAAGTILRAGPREQYLQVRAVVGDLLLLTRPLAASLAPGATLEPVTITPTGPTRTVVRPPAAGDCLVALDADLTADTVRVTDGVTGETTDHATGARADAAGFYQIGGVRGVDAVAVKATAAGLAGAQPPTVWRPDESRPVNPLDLSVRP